MTGTPKPGSPAFTSCLNDAMNEHVAQSVAKCRPPGSGAPAIWKTLLRQSLADSTMPVEKHDRSIYLTTGDSHDLYQAMPERPGGPAALMGGSGRAHRDGGRQARRPYRAAEHQ